MRAAIMAGLFLAAVSQATAGERSFAFDGHEYSLDFPSSFKFTGRKVQEGVEYVDFENGPLRLSFSTAPFSPEDVSPEDWKPLEGLRYEAAVNDGDFVMIGGCADEDKSCFFGMQKVFREHGRWLLASVGCGPDCGEADMLAAKGLADHLTEQLRRP